MDDFQIKSIPESKPFPKRTVAVVLIVLFLLSIGGYAGNIFISYLYGTDIENLDAFKDGMYFSFDQEVWNHIQKSYLENQEHEFIVCLSGVQYGVNYLFTDLHYPPISSQGFAHVSFEGCPSDTIATLHSHPNNRCRPSSQDKQTLQNMQEQNPDMVGFILCAKDRVGIYT